MILQFNNAAVDPLWHDLNMQVEPGEFIAVLGPNGAGKSTMLHAILGTRKLTAGTIDATPDIGFIPQQRMFPMDLPMRAKDLVGLSLAHGVIRGRRASKSAVLDLLREVGAEDLAERRVGKLSGGQQQLVRQAQAFANDPKLLLCDEPLLSLDPGVQQRTVARLDKRRRDHDTAILFVTHGINPILNVVNRVLYLAPYGHMIGEVHEVMRSDVLSELYRTRVDVVNIDGRLIVV
ncbi:metal ABC transporter ATP-binding protein [Corynebacterium hindlerae]|uniref:metal ABC transporter ATP-binding protein n=1 Tax=Corynebacterium hindlerae TaxID=699041 RepID=UPI001AD7C705|nr:metal ABC transporter ATP-binding protein [Corynebacterium hindlerae]QTH59489.1 metal ABC transporter ATP-binding protein [Corynebacterium hindlerae]